MPTPQACSLGVQFAHRFGQAHRELGQALSQGARELPCLEGLNPDGTAVVPMENLYSEATEHLAATGHFYLYDQNISVEVGHGAEMSLQLLTLGSRVVPNAPALVANYLTFLKRGAEGKPSTYFAPRPEFTSNLFARHPTRDAFPNVKAYARRPLYDEHFVLCGPGYHAEPQILVHGFDVEPVLPTFGDCGRPIRERLPHHIQTLFGGFCFRDNADLANGLATLVTGVTSNHFVISPKANPHLDGNQPGIGKSLFALMVGVVLDGECPDLIEFSDNDEELAKSTLAKLLQRPTSILIYDNARTHNGTPIRSAFLEANSAAPRFTRRILGKSANYSRPNDLLWCCTMNQSQLGPDLVSRGIPIRLYYEGKPEARVFDGPNPLEYALEHRLDILAELFGMVEFWKQRGRRLSDRPHRYTYWAQVVGGILEANGFPEFLANVDAAAADFNTELNDLAALAESVVRDRVSGAYTVVAHQHQE